MPYQKTVWVNGQQPAINADNLNKIEQGIFDATQAAEGFGNLDGGSPDSEYGGIDGIDAGDL